MVTFLKRLFRICENDGCLRIMPKSSVQYLTRENCKHKRICAKCFFKLTK